MSSWSCTCAIVLGVAAIAAIGFLLVLPWLLVRCDWSHECRCPPPIMDYDMLQQMLTDESVNKRQLHDALVAIRKRYEHMAAKASTGADDADQRHPAEQPLVTTYDRYTPDALRRLSDNHRQPVLFRGQRWLLPLAEHWQSEAGAVRWPHDKRVSTRRRCQSAVTGKWCYRMLPYGDYLASRRTTKTTPASEVGDDDDDDGNSRYRLFNAKATVDDAIVDLDANQIYYACCGGADDALLDDADDGAAQLRDDSGGLIVDVFESDDGDLTGIHNEVNSTLNMQLRGRKQWVLVDPRASDLLVPLPLSPQNCISALYTVGGAMRTRTTRVPHWRVVVEPGDMLFVPSWCWHECVSVGDSLSYSLRCAHGTTWFNARFNRSAPSLLAGAVLPWFQRLIGATYDPNLGDYIEHMKKKYTSSDVQAYVHKMLGDVIK